jgi:hypothetical protein
MKYLEAYLEIHRSKFQKELKNQSYSRPFRLLLVPEFISTLIKHRNELPEVEEYLTDYRKRNGLNSLADSEMYRNNQVLSDISTYLLMDTLQDKEVEVSVLQGSKKTPHPRKHFGRVKRFSLHFSNYVPTSMLLLRYGFDASINVDLTKPIKIYGEATAFEKKIDMLSAGDKFGI